MHPNLRIGKATRRDLREENRVGFTLAPARDTDRLTRTTPVQDQEVAALRERHEDAPQRHRRHLIGHAQRRRGADPGGDKDALPDRGQLGAKPVAIEGPVNLDEVGPPVTRQMLDPGCHLHSTPLGRPVKDRRPHPESGRGNPQRAGKRRRADTARPANDPQRDHCARLPAPIRAGQRATYGL